MATAPSRNHVFELAVIALIEHEPRHHQRQDDDRKRFDHELGEGQIGRAEQQEDQRHRKALHAERHDGDQPGSGKQHGRQAKDRDEDCAPFIEGEDGELRALRAVRR